MCIFPKTQGKPQCSSNLYILARVWSHFEPYYSRLCYAIWRGLSWVWHDDNLPVSLSLLVPKPEPTLPPLTFCTNMHSVNNIYKFYVILVDQNNTGPCWSASQNTATLVAKHEWIFKILQTGFVLSRKMLNLRCWNMHSSISFRRESLLSKNNK